MESLQNTLRYTRLNTLRSERIHFNRANRVRTHLSHLSACLVSSRFSSCHIMQPCNNSGFTDPASTVGWSIVSISMNS